MMAGLDKEPSDIETCRLTPHPARGVYPELLRYAQDRSKRSERARHPLLRERAEKVGRSTLSRTSRRGGATKGWVRAFPARSKPCPDRNFQSRLALLPLLLCLLILPASCGYHVGGKGALLPPDIKTIAVPIFQNKTTQFRIEQQLTAAVIQELIERTQYRVVSDVRGADAVLRGTVEEIHQGVVAYNPQTGSATALQIEVIAGVELRDLHSHKVVFSNPNYVFREEYQVSPNAQTFIEEDRPALERLSHDFARTLVTDILENF